MLGKATHAEACIHFHINKPCEKGGKQTVRKMRKTQKGKFEGFQDSISMTKLQPFAGK